jgi:hypothetical protein
MSGTTRGRGAFALAATVLFVAGCVRVPASIREDFAPLRPGEPSNFDPGPKGVAPAHEAVGYEPTPAPAPSPAPPSSVEPVPEVVAPPVPSATNAAPAAGAAS